MTHAEIDQKDLIDLYLLGRLPPEVEAAFEEHFLACRECADRLEANRETVAITMEAFALEDAEPMEKHEPRRGWHFRLPAPVWGLAAMVAVAAVYLTLAPHAVRLPPQRAPERIEPAVAPARPPVLELESYRAGATRGARITAAVAAKPFLLRLDLRGLDRYDNYTASVVGNAGEPVWSTAAIARSGADWLEVEVSNARLPAGVYWVRLSGERADRETKLLREYLLRVEP